MSNPVATFGNSISAPGDPQITRTTYSRIVYSNQDFHIYADDEYDATYTSFDPTDKGERFYMLVNLDEVLSSVKPDFVSVGSWEGLKKAPSGFLTPVRSIMPKIIIPSIGLVDNGWIHNSAPSVSYARINDGGTMRDGFNWEHLSFEGTSTTSSFSDIFQMGSIGGTMGSKYITVTGKRDSSSYNESVLRLENPAFPPLGSDHNWIASNSSDLVVGGAFVIMLNVCPSVPGTSAPEEVESQPWSVKFEFGDVVLDLSEGGSCKVQIETGDSSGNQATVNLANGLAKDGPPQQKHIKDGIPYIIVVYPSWNGIVIQSGVQDATQTVSPSSYFVPKIKGASVMSAPYSSGFDPTNPDEVEVTPETVDFGTSITATITNCRADLSYQPAFFCPKTLFDEFFITSDDVSGSVSFEYYVYPIWTDNNTSFTLGTPSVQSTDYTGPIANTSYSHISWDLSRSSGEFSRSAGEIFGSILGVDETRTFPVKNDNGNFDINWSGGSPAGSGGGWEDYVQSVSTSLSLDGSSGSITIDKHGVAGQEAFPAQSIGALTISASGGNGTNSGSIFQGLGMGISDSKSSAGAEWSVSLVGLEKKLEDIALINVPYFDGKTLGETCDFLARYAGLVADFSGARPNVQLSVSTDINVARFDWRSGTTVQSALDDVMTDTLHHYVIMDGKINFYELDEVSGLPKQLGTNWGSLYPSTRIISSEATPDFEDLRNEIVVIGLEEVSDGQGTRIEDLPIFPRVETRSTNTVPDYPWSKSIVQPLPGSLTIDEIEKVADNLQAMTSKYELLGRTTIPGNADIRPYDQWGDYIIYSVSQNIDFSSKVWTTDLEFMRFDG